MKFPWRKPKAGAGAASDRQTAAPSDHDAARGDSAHGAAQRVIRPEDFVGHDQAANERLVREGFVETAKRYLRMLPIAEEVVALYFCVLDQRTPIWVKGVAAAALAYFILPLDAVPDFLPMIGLGDDLSVLSAALAAVSTHLTPEHRAKARRWLAHEHIIDVTPGAPR